MTFFWSDPNPDDLIGSGSEPLEMISSIEDYRYTWDPRTARVENH